MADSEDDLMDVDSTTGSANINVHSAEFLDILNTIHHSGLTLGEFLETLFYMPKKGESARGPRHRAMVSKFLQGQSKVMPETIVELMYSSRDSAPKATRIHTQPSHTWFQSPTKATAAPMTTETPPSSRQNTRPPKENMARWRLGEWAVQKVEKFVRGEAAVISGREGGLHLTDEQTTWSFFHTFSFANLLTVISQKGPILLRILIAAAYNPGEEPPIAKPIPAMKITPLPPLPPSHSTRNDAVVPPETEPTQMQQPPGTYTTYTEYFLRPVASGRGKNLREPLTMIILAFMILMSCRNLQFSMFRKVFGVWLFSQSTPHAVYGVMSRIGLSSSYTSVLALLRKLSTSAQAKMRAHAKSRAFLLVFDNINQMRRARDPDLGEKDRINNGTAATYVEMEDCNIKKAFDIATLTAAKDQQLRKDLTVDVLFERIDMQELNSVMSLHALSFLIHAVPSLAHHQAIISDRFRTTHAKHRMREGRTTNAHPMATSNHDAGNTASIRDVINDLVIRQLKLEREELKRIITIFTGDQKSVELTRTLKKFLDSCPHGYERYGWVLPLIQLWHMGWADLERILSTHWGKTEFNPELGDISSFHFVNSILRRKIKDVKRPDYYPAQRFIFDNLKVEVLDCWKLLLGTKNLSAYFETHNVSLDHLMKISNTMVSRYMSVRAADAARTGNISSFGFPVGTSWPRAAGDEQIHAPRGDDILANTILRMRDSMLHYEFQFAVSDGDIGRAMNVMSVWTFTFAGSGKSKYANELLELTCNFEYEYCKELQEAILNNWLCNLTGIPGCWFPMDLLQEHNIKQLKKMSERGDAEWGGKFFQEIVSYNIRAFLHSIETMRDAVRLNAKGGSHRLKAKNAAMSELARAMEERELHKFRRSRTRGHVAADDFETGYISFAETSRIKDFITRTLLDASSINTEVDDARPSGDSETEMEMDVPLPNVIQDGQMCEEEDWDGYDSDGSNSDMDAMDE